MPFSVKSPSRLRRLSDQISDRHPFFAEKSRWGAIPPETYDFFQKLRDKTIVHDQNAVSQSYAAAILNDGSKAPFVEAVESINVFYPTLVEKCPWHPAVKTRRLNELRTLVGTLSRHDALV